MGLIMKDKAPTTRTETAPRPAEPGRVDRFVEALARAPRPGTAGRLLFALDATMSRERTWDRACTIQAEMFREAGTVNGLAMKLVYFRGLDECRASAWKTDGRDLARAMAGIATLGGQTQIGRVLDFARRQVAEAPVPALVYIGDAVEEDPDPLARKAGQLGLLGCRLFLFHEGHDARAGRAFESMARASGGGYFRFDERSADRLAGLLRAVARFASGGRAALEGSGPAEGRLLLEQMR